MKPTKTFPPLILGPHRAAPSEKVKDKAATETYRPAQQKRSAKTETKLLAAAEQLFAERGYMGTKIADIIALSGCSTGSFYHRFGDKEGLARVLVERFVADTSEALNSIDLSRKTHGSLREMLRFYTTLTYETMTARLGVYRSAQRVAQTAPELWEGAGEMRSIVNQKALEVLPDYSDEILAEDQASAMTSAVQLIILITLQTRLGSGPLLPNDSHALIDVIVKAALGVLCLKGANDE